MTNSIERSYEDILTVKELSLFERQSLKNIIKKEGFLLYKVNVKDISTNGGNYFGILRTVTIKDQSDDGDKELNLFLKSIVRIDETSVLDTKEAYLREGFFYYELLNLYEKIQDKYNIPKEERLNAVKGYGGKNSEVVIMEDISRAGYKTYDRFDGIPLKFAELAIEQLGKLHALSFALQKEYPKYFENTIKPMSTMYRFNVEFETHLRRIFNKAMETLEDDAKTKLDGFFPKVLEKYRKYLDVPADEAVCLLHGDFRANNILVKEIDGEASSVMPVDYQFLSYGYPVIDFLYFIFTSTDQQFRKNHLENLKQLYYKTLEKNLCNFNIEAESVYPKKQFEDEYTEMLDYGLIAFMTLMPFIFAKTDDVPDLENGLEGVNFNLDERYKYRLHGIVDDFIQWGYL